MPFPWEEAFWGRGCSRCLWSFAPSGCSRGSLGGSGDGLLDCLCFQSRAPGQRGPPFGWRALAAWAAHPTPVHPNLQTPPLTHQTPSCTPDATSRESPPPKLQVQNTLGLDHLFVPADLQVWKGEKCSFIKAINDHLSLGGDHFIRLHATMQKEENN